ncbi:excinuclease ABC subunit UvrC [Halofilum ochraceum]|uniref:excinuclease ABC subunit UvrC n=1 Tax=Halofilum ochraceum TaxID=1611323 RepID=UPI0008DA2B74|nr:excinuclease ABC subunit UvrC [Halofilum ochraceum]
MTGEQDNTAGFDAKAFLRTVTTRPGVYRMLDERGTVIYVGKAANLRNRLASYFRGDPGSTKTRIMVSHIADVQVTVTHTEAEALLLEHTLIKEHRPRYNVLLRDDKSYPYIYLSTQDHYPRLAFHRGSTRGPGKYFGPYPSPTAVRSTLYLMQKVFRVRQCTDSYFSNRSRPCLQYQIGRCTAPCVGYISEEEYARDVEHARLFLEGRETQVLDSLVQRMEEASAQLDFETAAQYRDRIQAIRRVRERQHVSGEGGDLDVVACRTQAAQSCVTVFFVRNGHNLGNKTFFPRTPDDAAEEDVLYAFLTQFYLEHDVPSEILLSHAVDDADVLAEVLRERAGHRVTLSSRLRGERRRWMDLARSNAADALGSRLASRAGMAARLDSLSSVLGLDTPPGRMECFDISHTRGEATVASCVVFGPEGALRREYRRFNIEGIEPGDDYAAMRQAVQRRYSRLQREDRPLPDVVFIDGGKGQLGQAREVLDELGIGAEELLPVGIAKGPERKPGMETLYIGDTLNERHLAEDTPGLHLIQQIRDEAHRFAISGHRGARAKSRNRSVLEDIPGLGPKRRAQLLKHFGGLQGVRKAGVEDLAAVPGISTKLARIIYDATHGSGSGAP